MNYKLENDGYCISYKEYLLEDRNVLNIEIYGGSIGYKKYLFEDRNLSVFNLENDFDLVKNETYRKFIRPQLVSDGCFCAEETTRSYFIVEGNKYKKIATIVLYNGINNVYNIKDYDLYISNKEINALMSKIATFQNENLIGFDIVFFIVSLYYLGNGNLKKGKNIEFHKPVNEDVDYYDLVLNGNLGKIKKKN